MDRVYDTREFAGHTLLIREAREEDIPLIQGLFQKIYYGKYPLDFGVDACVLRTEIAERNRCLWLVAQVHNSQELVGGTLFQIDPDNRFGKVAGSLVMPELRKQGLGSSLLQLGMTYLTEQNPLVDVFYSITRTVNIAPSRLVADVGFQPMGLFPNAIQIESLENLNLDVYLTSQALQKRRRHPFLFGPFYDVYQIARERLGLEMVSPVTERSPLALSRKKIQFHFIQDSDEVTGRFRLYSSQKRLSNSFFPFHTPNWCLESDDRGTEVFVWYGGVGKQAFILGYRTDRVNIHDVLDSIAFALQNAGAAYVEFLIDAYDYKLQQEAYTARYIPSAYFPAMRLEADGLRDDYIVVSRTFRLLDFTNCVVTGDHFKFLQVYLRCYQDLYIAPLLGKSVGFAFDEKLAEVPFTSSQIS